MMLEGTYALNERIRELLDLRISMGGGMQHHLVEKVCADLSYSEAMDHKTVTERLFPLYSEVATDLGSADIRVRNTFDPVSMLLRPLYVLKTEHTVASTVVKQELFGWSPSMSQSDCQFQHWVRHRTRTKHTTLVVLHELVS